MNSSNPYDSETRQNATGVLKMWEFLKSITTEGSYDRIFVASDSDQVIEQARNQKFGDKLISIEGPVLHVDRSRGVDKEAKCAGLERLVLEEHLLMTCDVLVVSHSGVGHTAAHVRGTDHQLYCWLKGVGVVPCKREDLMRIFFDYVYEVFTHGTCDDVYERIK